MFSQQISAWLSYLRRRSPKARCRKLRLRCLPSLEALEARTVLTDLTWTGAVSTDMGNARNWTTPNNLPSPESPGATDFLVFKGAPVRAAVNNAALTVAGINVDSTYTSSITLNSDLDLRQNVKAQDAKKKPIVSSTIAGGTITGNGSLIVTPATPSPVFPVPTPSYTLFWTGGTITGSATVNPSVLIHSGAGLNIQGPTGTDKFLLFNNRQLFNAGLILWSKGNLQLGGNASIQNNGQFKAYTGAGTLSSQKGLNSLANKGLLYLAANPGTTLNFNLPILNSGSYNIGFGGDMTIYTPTIQVLGGGVVSFNGGGYNAGAIRFSRTPDAAEANEDSTLRFGAAGKFTLYNFAFTWRAGATLLIDNDAACSEILVEGSSPSLYPTLIVNKAATFTVPDSGVLRFSYALLEGPGTVKLAAGSTGTISAMALDGITINVDGAAKDKNGDTDAAELDFSPDNAVADDTTVLYNGTTITNNGTVRENGVRVVFYPARSVIPATSLINLGTLYFNGGSWFAISKTQTTAGTFTNNGTFYANGQGKIDIPFLLQAKSKIIRNPGTDLKAKDTRWLGGPQVGALQLEGALSTTATTLAVSPGSAITGEGTVDWEQTLNEGDIVPGESGLLSFISFQGDLFETGAGAIDISLSNPATNTTADQVEVTGIATLGGALNINFSNGFSPTSAGQTYDILTAGVVTGTFAGINITGPGYSSSSYALDVRYTSTDVYLDVVALPSAPTITAVSTSTGSTAGGGSETITGTNFSGVQSVLFGSVPALSYIVDSATQITAVAPPQAAGTADITVTTAAGSATTSFGYTTGATPTVTALSATSDYLTGDSTITITGTNFTGANGVSFGSVPAAYFKVLSDTQISVVVPSATAAGTDDVTVTTFAATSATSSADQFTYSVQPAPTVTSLGTTSGSSAGGTSVTITGTNFTNVDEVWFGDQPATSFTVSSSTSIVAIAPSGAAGSADVSVVTDGGTSALSSSDQYTYTAATTALVSVLDTTTGSTAGGTPVTLTGNWLSGASAVYFGSVPATWFIINNDTQITAIAPPQAAGTVPVTVVTPTGTSAVLTTFTYTAASAPTVTGLSTATGTTAGGTVITVTGTGFTAATGISFGSVAATDFTVLSDTSLIVTAPPQAAGTVDITVTTDGGTSATSSADLFTISAASLPTVSAASPGSGSALGGDPITITGSGFTGATAINFGSTSTTDFSVLDDSTILVYAPPGSGSVNITVTSFAGTSTSYASFSYTAVSAPTVTALSTSSGSTNGGTQVVLTGTGFSNVSEVDFGTTPVYDFVVNSDTQLTVTAPPAPAGVVDITVTGAAGTSAATSASRFTSTLASTAAVTGLSTSSGTSAGGTAVTITGTDFSGALDVAFGGISVPYTVNSDTSITAISPPQAAGTYDITVTTYSGISASVTADQFTVTTASAPTVTALATTSGSTAGGTLVNLTGTGFTGATAVNFGLVAAAFTINSDTSITAYAPAQAAGTVDTTVVTFAGTSSTSSSDQFTYNAQSAPTISSLTPNTGPTPGGTPVLIVGSNFTSATAVTFAGVPAVFVVNSDTSITAWSPPEAAGSASVVVTTFGGTSSGSTFTYTNVTASAPAVTAISLATGSTAGGQPVTITGTNFSGASGVSFGGTAATFTIVSDTEILATAPAASAGTIDITVTTNNGTSSTTSADQFDYLSTAVPTVTSLGTGTGTTDGGTSVNISGTNFGSASAVMFGDIPAASFTINSSTSITAIAPAQAVGTVDITVTTPSGTSATSVSDQFAYTAALPPTVTALGTSSGSTAGGTSVAITGTNLLGTVAVFFGSLPAASFTINSSTSITAISPPQAAGTMDVTVETYSGTSAANSSERYTFNAASTATVTSLGTTTGTTDGGTSVAITGTDFLGTSQVMFGAVPAASFTVNSSTSITAIAPAQTAGTFDVTVQTPTGTSASTSADQFTVTAASAPTVTGLGTTTGSTAGGTSVVISGTGFTATVAVMFGPVSASFTVNSSTSITAIAPPQAAGTPDVTVTTTAGTSATSSSDMFTYTAASAPSVSAVAPNSGSVVGGTSVTITGSNFTGASAVNFGSTAASFTLLNDGAILAVAPAGTVGTDDITVTTPSGTSSTSSSDHFIFTAVTAPTVTALSVSSGTTAGGTTVTITGTGFLDATAVAAVFVVLAAIRPFRCRICRGEKGLRQQT